MKKINVKVFVIGILTLFSGSVFAQSVSISGEVRPRFEYRHGYKTLIPDGKDAASFISQRTRLNAYYGNSTFKFKLSLQNVSVWGDVKQLNQSDVNGTAIHEAWGEVMLSKKLSIKVGRQEIIYDGHRIFGNVGWTQQARSHDAAIIKFTPSKSHKVDIGLALNANGESLYKTDYTVNSYRAFQYLWYHGNFDKVELSFLVLNNGMAYTDITATDTTQKVAYSQTIGPRVTYKSDAISFNAAFYYQGGKDKFNHSLSAMYFTANASYAVSKKFKIGLGGEYLSGTSSEDQAKTDPKDKSFKPFYGTNHKFNGWMDYFYVGSYMYSNGLIDINLPLVLKIEKFTFKLIPHYFMAAAQVAVFEQQPVGETSSWKDYSNGLGTEIDFSVGYAVSNSMVISGGYSQMFATETMQILKGGNYKNTNNWAWVMMTFKPTFFSKN